MMTPELQRLIDIRMFVDFRAKPWANWRYSASVEGGPMVCPYQSDHQRLWVEFDLQTRKVTVYSFTQSFVV